jgi:aminoglycoside phosphotransferase (APT) family kinase protein
MVASSDVRPDDSAAGDRLGASRRHACIPPGTGAIRLAPDERDTREPSSRITGESASDSIGPVSHRNVAPSDARRGEVLRALGLPEDAALEPASGGASGSAWRVRSSGETWVLRTSGSRSMADSRLAAMAAASAAGLPAPRLAARATVGDEEVVLLSWLPGITMLEAMTRRDVRAEALGRLAGEMQRSLHQLRAPDTVRALETDPDRPFNAGRDVVGIPAGDRLLHLDWHPLNLLVDTDGRRITGVVDWDNARRGHPLFDVARTESMLVVEPALATLPATVRAMLDRFRAGWVDGYGPEAAHVPPTCRLWAGRVMLADLGPRYGPEAPELEPVRAWTASWT